MPSKISNAVESQDDKQDMSIINSYIHYIPKGGVESSESGDETGENLNSTAETCEIEPFEIEFQSEFTKVSEVFDQYSDFYIDPDDFTIDTEFDNSTETTSTDDTSSEGS